VTVEWKQKDTCNDEEYNSDDDADGNDARDSNDGDGTGERECDKPCTLPDEEEPGENVEQKQECDFSVEISDGINSEDSGQEPSCVSVSATTKLLVTTLTKISDQVSSESAIKLSLFIIFILMT